MNFHSFKSSLAYALAALPGVLPVYSQQSPEPASGEVTTLDPLVVFTTPTAAPNTLVADPRNPVQPVPAQDGAEALRSVPGFSVIRKGGTDGDPVLRGMAGSRVGIMVDCDCLLGGCGNRMDPPTAYVFPAAYDKITVIKGPSTVIYGPGNSAGLVLFERTLRRLEGPEHALYLNSTAGSRGRFDLAGDLFGGDRLWQSRITATTTRSDGYRDGSGGLVHAAYERWSTNASFVLTPKAGWSFELAGALSDGEAAYADRAMDGVAFDRQNLALRARYEGQSGPLGAVEFRSFVNRIDHVMDNYSLRPFAATMMMPYKAVSNPDRRTAGAALRTEWVLAEGVGLIAGLDGQYNWHGLRSTMNEDLDPYEQKVRMRDARFRQTGAFAEVKASVSETSRVFAGFRADGWSVTDLRAKVNLGMMSSLTNPTAGLRVSRVLPSGFARYEHDFSEGTATVFAGLGHVRRFGDYWELIKNEAPDSLSALRSKPEATTQLDVGVLKRHKGATYSLSLFANQIDDFLLVQSGWVKAAMGGKTRSAVVTRNVEARTLGGEASASIPLSAKLKFEGALTAVRGTNRSDDRPLAQLPPVELRTGLVYTGWNGSVGVLLRSVARQDRVAVGQGSIVGQDIGETPGHAVLSLNGAWRFSEKLRVSAGIDNVFDREYAEHLSRSGSAVAGFEQTLRVNEPGRVFWLRLDSQF